MTRHRLRVTIEDQAEARYPRLPFAVGREASVEVELRYDKTAAVVDLGCEGPRGWVGWSGGARESFVVTHDTATPGYLPGVEPGEWFVVLGLHKVPAEGVEIEVDVHVPARRCVEPEPDRPPPTPEPRASARRLPASDGLTWFAGDFHSHSVHSDGVLSLPQLASAATGRGLDFLAVTEHNTTSHVTHLPGVGSAYDITLIPGQEVTTHRGHANALGDVGWVDFRRHPDEWLRQCEAEGGLLSVNHPLQDDCAWQHVMSRAAPLLELWHISWFLDLSNTAPWALWARWPQSTRIIGGSDFHSPAEGFPPGTPTTWVAAEDRSPAAILDAVRAGRTAISRFPTPGDPVLIPFDDEALALEGDGAVVVDLDGTRHPVRGDRVRVPRSGGVQRLVAADGTLLAIC